MTVIYLAAFILGLLLGIRIMLYGVERPREQNPTGERSFRGSPAILCAFAMVFGSLGYTLTRQGVGGDISGALIAAVLAVAAAFARHDS